MAAEVLPLRLNLQLEDFQTEMLHVHLVNLQHRVFSVCPRVPQPLSFLLVVTKAAFKTTEEDEQEIQEVGARPAAADAGR